MGILICLYNQIQGQVMDDIVKTVYILLLVEPRIVDMATMVGVTAAVSELNATLAIPSSPAIKRDAFIHRYQYIQN